MKRVTLFIVAMFLFSGIVSAYSPLDFVSSSSGLLREGESVNSFIEISGFNTSVYVLPVLSGENIVGYMVLKTEEKDFEGDETRIEQLLKTAIFINNYVEFKNSVAENNSSVWLLSDSRVAKNMPSFLDQEEVEINIISSELPGEASQAIVANLKTKLDNLSNSFVAIGTKMEEINKREPVFLSKPSVRDEISFLLSFTQLLGQIRQLDIDALEYNSKLKELQAIISVSSLNVETKKSLLELSAMPDDFFIAGTWASKENNYTSALQDIESSATNLSNAYLEGFIDRLNRLEAYNYLFSDTSGISSKTKGQFTTINDAVDNILKDDAKFLWKEKNEVRSLESNWNKSIKSYESGNYATAISQSQDASKNIEKILKSGFVEPDVPVNNNALLQQIALVLIAILIVIIVVRNYRKFLHKDGEDL